MLAPRSTSPRRGRGGTRRGARRCAGRPERSARPRRRGRGLRRRRLELPLGTIERATLRSNFDERRGGTRRHEAMDLLAPRHTPVVAVEAGIIARLFNSKAGGITVYQFDPTTSYAYYYAHLERYAAGLEEGATVGARPGAGLRRHVGQRAGEHAAPALCDLRPRRGQALVAGHAGRPVPSLSVTRLVARPIYALASPRPPAGHVTCSTVRHGRTNPDLAGNHHRDHPT